MRFDLVIVGGGLVGAGLAAALRSSGLHIALVDARLPSNDDPRLFALNNGCCQFLENLGLWSRLQSHASPIHQVHVSNQGRFGSVRLNREDAGLSSLGHVIPAHYIEAALNEDLLSLPNVTLFRPARLKSLEQQDGLATLLIDTEEGEKYLTSPIVIGADGTESTVRALVNIGTKISDYEQSAIVTRTRLQRPHQHVAYERFNSDGAIAMLPLTGNECATIWTAKNTVIDELMALNDQEFLQRLQKEFGYRVGRMEAVSKRHVFPLRMVMAEKAVDQCVFLLGNSAHTLHPIAAQGFNLAMYEVAVLVERIMEKMEKHETLSTHDLQNISEQIQQQQKTSIGVSHRLTQLFSSNSPMISFVLQLGMVGLDVAMPVKRKFIGMIMGRSGRVPRLLLSANE